jgi:hypothetical protein
MTLTHIEASRNLLAVAREGRLIQGTWHREEEDGRELACLLYAMGNGVKIDAPDKCPSSVMPEWMAHLAIGLFDSQEREAAIAWGIRLGEQMGREEWGRIAWESVRRDLLIGTVDEALEHARKTCSAEPYWQQVESACRQVQEALRGNGDLSAAESAARSAARSAAWSAAWRAAWSAASAARSAARSAASAAGSAAGSAAASAAGSAARSAAWTAAWSAAWSAAASAARSVQATRLCDLIDAAMGAA